jgi:guanylate kinase
MSPQAKKNRVVVIAGPSGSGKDTVVREVMKRVPGSTLTVTATTRAPRPGEVDGVNYHFMDNARFKKEMEQGNILEHYYRDATDTYYGTYKPDIEARLARGELVFCVIQIVGAKYMKEHYDALTIFIEPKSIEEFEARIRARAPMTDAEWQERKEFTERELAVEAPWYDYRVVNADGELNVAVDSVVEILKKEKYIG